MPIVQISAPVTGAFTWMSIASPITVIDQNGCGFPSSRCGNTQCEEHQRISRLARRIFNVPSAMVTLHAHLGHMGASARCEALAHSSLWAHTIGSDEALIVLDTAADPRFADCGLVTETPGIRFYAAEKLVTAEGDCAGVLALIDTVPRAEFSMEDRQALHDLAVWTAATAVDPASLSTSSHSASACKHSAERQKLKAAKEEAERANKAKNEFLSRVSHELRTPMNSILGFAQLVKMDGLTPDQESNMARILRAGKHLLDLMNEVLDISRIESDRLAVELEKIEVKEAVRSAVELVQPLLDDRRIELNILSPECARTSVLADRVRLKQVLLNIIGNAVKYNREGGQITVRFTGCDEHLRIHVADTGKGIAPELLPKLFLPFERLGAERTNVPGTGLGLALTKRLVELMRGRIGADSEVGLGTTFWVELPFFEETVQEANALSSSPTLESAENHPVTVLYVEDNLSSIHLIRGILKRFAGVRVISAMQGSLGLEMARLHSPDLILLDLHLTDLSGFQVLRSLQQDPGTRSIPVVVVSADELPGTKRQALESGARAFLSKPVNVNGLLATINPLLERAV